MLGDCSPGGGGDEGGGGGDVEGAAGVAASAAGVDEERPLGVVERDGDCGGAHGFDEAGEFGCGFAAGCDGSEKRGEFDPPLIGVRRRG